jgi:DNA repair exonuclease SbcCD ATPase subunit
MNNPELKKTKPTTAGAADSTAASGGRASSPASELMEGGSIDKIRDILFGAQSRDFDKRMARLEERIAKETAELRDEMKKRLDSIQAYAQKEIEDLGDRIKAEQAERTEALREIARELKETASSLEKKLGQLDDQSMKGQRELRQQILDQSKSLSEEIRQRHEALAAAMEREIEELREQKTDRSALAALFTEMALRVSDQFKLPTGE